MIQHIKVEVEMIDLNDLMVFLKVVEQGSFTLAAQALDLPKSNISRKITRLEDNLSVRLLERSTRSLHLTEIGQVYFEHCLRIYAELQDAKDSIESMANVATGTIKLGSSVSIGQGLLPKLFANFNKQYPLIKLDLKLTNRRVDVIEEGFDLVIRVGESPDSSLISKKLFPVSLHLYASEAYLTSAVKQGKAIKKVEDIAAHDCLYMNAVDSTPQWHLVSEINKDHQQDHVISIDPVVSCNDFNSLKHMASEGLGIALLPDYFVNEHAVENNLVRVLDHCVSRTVNLYAVFPSRKGVTPKLRAFLDFLAKG